MENQNGKTAVILCSILEGTSLADTINDARRTAAKGERDQAKFSDENFVTYLIELGAGALKASVKSSAESKSARELKKELTAAAMIGQLTPEVMARLIAKHGIGGTQVAV